MRPCPEPPRGLREPRDGLAAVGAAPRALLYIGGNSGNNWNTEEAKLHTWLSKEQDLKAGLAVT